MSERYSLENIRSRRLPPAEAWKRPDKWIDIASGLPKQDISKLVLHTDDRGFLDPDQVVDHIEDMFFWKDYNWPYSPRDQETAPDDHHFYYTEAEYSATSNNGSTVPSRFRGLPTVIGRMPRQFHNVIHDFTVKTGMPELDAMEEYTKSYYLAHKAFKNLIESARNTSQASHMFTQRQQALLGGNVLPTDPKDVVVKEIMRDFFYKHFNAYSQSMNRVLSLPERSLIAPNIEAIHQHKPHLVIKKIGKYILRDSIDYIPQLQSA
jgi:hypothetical protein